METASVTSATHTSGMSDQTQASTAALDENYDLFLSVLTAQMENQSPLDPVDTEEMTSQLIEYSQAEQQILTNQYLESLVLSTNNQSAETALSFIGKDVTYDGSTQDYAGDPLTWSMEVPEGADTLTFQIYNDNNKLVYQSTASAQGGSGYDFGWDGATTGNGTASDGAYTLAVEAAMADGTTAGVDLQGTSRGTEVVWTSGVPELVLANGTTIGLDQIISAKEAESGTA